MAINLNLVDLENIIDRVLTRRLGPACLPPPTTVPVYQVAARPTIPTIVNRLPPPPPAPASPPPVNQGLPTNATIPRLLDLQFGPPHPDILASCHRIFGAWPQRDQTAHGYQHVRAYDTNFPPLPPPTDPEGWQTVHRRDRRPRPTSTIVAHSGPVRHEAAKLLATTIRIQQQYRYWKRQLPPSIDRRLSQLFHDIKPAGRPSSSFNDHRDEAIDTTREMIAQLVLDELARSYRHNIDQLHQTMTPDRVLAEAEALELLHGSTIHRDVIDAVFRDARPPPVDSSSRSPSATHQLSAVRTDRPPVDHNDSSSSDDSEDEFGMDTDQPIPLPVLPPLPPRVPKTPKRKRASPPAIQASVTKRRLNSPPPPPTPSSRQLFPQAAPPVTPPTAGSDMEPSDSEASPAPPHAAASHSSPTPPTKSKPTPPTSNSRPATPLPTQPPRLSSPPLDPVLFSPVSSPRPTPPPTPPPAATQLNATTSAESDIIPPDRINPAPTVVSSPSQPHAAAVTTPIDPSTATAPDDLIITSTPRHRSFRLTADLFRPPAQIIIIGDSNVHQWQVNDPRLRTICLDELSLLNMSEMCRRILLYRPDLSALVIAVGLTDACTRPPLDHSTLGAVFHEMATIDPRILFVGLPEFERASIVEGANIVLLNKLARSTFRNRFIRVDPSTSVDLDNTAQPQLAYGPSTGGNVYKSVANFLNNCCFFSPLSHLLIT